VEGIDFDTQDQVLRVTGRNIAENVHVKLGAYHTLDLELNKQFLLEKDEWDVISLQRIESATDVTKYADLGAILMQDGLANILLVTENMTTVRAKIESTIPRKRKALQEAHQKGLIKFFDSVYQGLLRHINFEIVKCVLIASPGFLKDQFFDYLMQESTKTENKVILDNKSKFLLVHSSSGFKSSLKEILADPTVATKLGDTKAASEVKALETFYSILGTDSSRAFYGYNHVYAASQRLAIQTLLLSDSLFRAADVPTRKKYAQLVEAVKDNNGEIKIFSSSHVSGDQLAQLSGVAAILRFGLPDIEEEADDDEAAENEPNVGA